MTSYLVAFVTGLTTGGLSCLAVQGGLIATALPATDGAGRSGARAPVSPDRVTPILLFLAAKLAAYTVLGLLLGAVGSMLQLTPAFRAGLLIAIGIFMVGNGLRMLNVHPIFRYFVLEPPAAVTRALRRKAKGGATAVTPLVLGAMTVLIPCGVTQAMMALAMGTGKALEAAGLMAAFTLGSSVVFFGVVALATRLGALLERHFMRAVAVVLLVLGLVSVDSGLNLMGAPFSFARLMRAARTPAAAVQESALSTAAPGTAVVAEGPEGVASEVDVLRIDVLNDGYAPATLRARAGVPSRLTFVTRNVRSCSRALVIPELGVEKILDATGEATFDVPPQPAGKVLRYSCSMGMYAGEVVYE